MKFKIGDIITSHSESHYSKVIKINGKNVTHEIVWLSDLFNGSRIKIGDYYTDPEECYKIYRKTINKPDYFKFMIVSRANCIRKLL